uniref:Uncharacterized protein n=1 Tax=Romanomermis culicivorax TaxID=13658 RepID=A0A915KJ79_ROMCU
MPRLSVSAINEVTLSRRMTDSVIKYPKTVLAKKTNPKISENVFIMRLANQSLTEPEVLAQLKKLKDARNARST